MYGILILIEYLEEKNMFTRIKLQKLDDFFTETKKRPKNSVYFYRITEYNEEIATFIQTYYEDARKNGVIIEGKIPNPNEQQLKYYEEIMGMQFQMSPFFFVSALQKWLPRMHAYQRQNVANAIYDALEGLRKTGKTEPMLKNAYIKFMCWLYYKFERLLSRLGEQNIPKILYEGDVSSYELILLSILSSVGCDVVLLQYHGDEIYLKIDKASFYSDKLVLPNTKAFPQDFSLKKIREDVIHHATPQRREGVNVNVGNVSQSQMKNSNLSHSVYTRNQVKSREPVSIKTISNNPVSNVQTQCVTREANTSEANTIAHIGTTAYYAERELDTLLYENTGLYRNKQYQKANTLILQTMYEEIRILWNEELKYREGFCTEQNQVTLPVIFAKVSGVKEKDVFKYWASISELITEDTIVIKNTSYMQTHSEYKIKTSATEFFRNGKVQTQKIKANPNYPYGVLREEMQEYMFEKLQLLIEKKFIKGTFQTGMEYKIITTVLGLPKEIVRLIQKFDFTKKNPKLLYINTKEQVISLEDAIMMAFLHLVGFDIVCFIPTGYQSVERYFQYKMMEEHQIGEYLYDLEVPNLSVNSVNTHISWREKLFGRNKL